MMKIRVLHLTSTRYGIGGVEKLLLDMADKYDERAFDVFYTNLFCDADDQGVFPNRLREANLSYLQIKGRRWHEVPRIVWHLAKILRNERIDILHLHMLQATVVGGLAAAIRPKVRTVITKHYSDDLSTGGRMVKLLDHFFTRRVNRIIAISEHIKDDLLKLSVPADKIEVIHNGTDLRAFDQKELIEAPPLSDDDGGVLTIGTIASLTPRKGHKFLIEAFPKVLNEFPNTQLLIVGEGPEKERLERLCDTLGVAGKVHFVGFSDNVADVLRQFDLYVHPSIAEPFGIAVLEAMAAEKCVIATDVDGLPEIVVNGRSGFLVPARNPDDLARAIIEAIRNPDLTAEMGKCGRQRVENFFSIDNTTRAYQEVYKGLVKGK